MGAPKNLGVDLSRPRRDSILEQAFARREGSIEDKLLHLKLKCFNLRSDSGDWAMTLHNFCSVQRCHSNNFKSWSFRRGPRSSLFKVLTLSWGFIEIRFDRHFNYFPAFIIISLLFSNFILGEAIRKSKFLYFVWTGRVVSENNVWIKSGRGSKI